MISDSARKAIRDAAPDILVDAAGYTSRYGFAKKLIETAQQLISYLYELAANRSNRLLRPAAIQQ